MRPPSRRGAVRLRRARCLAASWRGGRLTLENFLAQTVVSIDSIAIPILEFFSDWRTPASLARAMPEFQPASLARAIALLERHALLVREHTPAARNDDRLARKWADWLPQASYHFATKDSPFVPIRKWRGVAKTLLAASAPPSLYKTYPGRRRVALPRIDPVREGASEFARVLLARKTHRTFSRKPAPLASIAALLHYTWGAHGFVVSENFGKLLHKTSPSGGARHPGEVYLVARNVAGLAPGIYHFNVRRSTLERLKRMRRQDVRRALLHFAVGQPHAGSAAAVFVMTSVFPRSMWKYKSPRAYRVVTLDTGHLGQTFCLVATWLGLAPFTTAALRDTAIERALGIDGISESVMYLAGVGLPKEPSL